MANLVITVVAIALVAATVAISTFFGGGVFFESEIDAEALRLLNAKQQILSAIALYETQEAGGVPVPNENQATGLDFLAPSYLTRLPKGIGANSWILTAKYIVTVLGEGAEAMNQCQAAREASALTGPVLSCKLATENDPCCVCDAASSAPVASGGVPECQV